MSLQSRAKRRLATELRRLAQRLSRWADATDQPAAPPRPPEPEASASAEGGPPEHWLALVREQAPQLLEGKGEGYKLDPGSRAWRPAPRPGPTPTAIPSVGAALDPTPATPPTSATAAKSAAIPTTAAATSPATAPARAAARNPTTAPSPTAIPTVAAALASATAPNPTTAPRPTPGAIPTVAAALAATAALAPTSAPAPAAIPTVATAPALAVWPRPAAPGPGAPPVREAARHPVADPDGQVRPLSVREREILDVGVVTRASRPSFEWPRPYPELPDGDLRWPALPDDREQYAWAPGLERLDPDRAGRLDREQRGL